MKLIIDIPDGDYRYIKDIQSLILARGTCKTIQKDVIDAIKNGTPYEEQLAGEWITNNRYKRKGKKFLDCSVCHYGEKGDVMCEVSKTPNYCPNCGAKMKGGIK